MRFHPGQQIWVKAEVVYEQVDGTVTVRTGQHYSDNLVVLDADVEEQLRDAVS